MLQNKSQSSQAGNVFIIILAGIFLFGALMFTFSKSGQKGSGNLTKHQSKIAAQEILNYARLVEGAVDRARRNGCSENEISFVNAVVAGYSNPNAPVDGSCNVFSNDGGKIEYIAPSQTMFESSASSGTTYGENMFSGHNTAYNVGNAATDDLIFFIHFLKKDVCLSVNNLLGINNLSGAPPDEGTGLCTALSNKFTGGFGPGTCGMDINPEYDKETSACIKTLSDSDDSYSFYQVLLAR